MGRFVGKRSMLTSCLGKATRGLDAANGRCREDVFIAARGGPDKGPSPRMFFPVVARVVVAVGFGCYGRKCSSISR